MRVGWMQCSRWLGFCPGEQGRRTHRRIRFWWLITYETKWRGIEAKLPTLQLLDLTAYGRQETWEDSPASWPQVKAGS
jgi:predicted dithiol-disulfide oxidoreductase (DUF899 family)